MKKAIFILFTINFSLFTIHAFSQSCLPEGITFTTQAEIDNFQINYPYCTEIEGDVWIGAYPSSNIANLNGLGVITSILGALRIVGNDSLLSLAGLESLDYIGGGLGIAINHFLTSLTGLGNLQYIGGGVSIAQNAILSSLTGLENLTSIMGSLYFGTWGPTFSGGNPMLSNCEGLNNLTMIGGDFWIFDNDALINFTGLENLTSIGGSLNVGFYPYGPWGNPSLTSFDGLNNLSSINGNIQIKYNPLLTSLSGLDNIDAGSIGNLQIQNNASLSNCDVQSICDYLAIPNGTVTIHNNAPGCNNPPEVADACGNTMPCLP